jgi:hypothetical protein
MRCDTVGRGTASFLKPLLVRRFIFRLVGRAAVEKR